MTASAKRRWGRQWTGTRTGCPPLPSLTPSLTPPSLLPLRSPEGKRPAAEVRTYWLCAAEEKAYCWSAARMPAPLERESVS